MGSNDDTVRLVSVENEMLINGLIAITLSFMVFNDAIIILLLAALYSAWPISVFIRNRVEMINSARSVIGLTLAVSSLVVLFSSLFYGELL